MLISLSIMIVCLLGYVVFYKMIPTIVYRCKLTKIRRTIGNGISCSSVRYYYIFDVNEFGEETFTVYKRTSKGLVPMQEISIPNDASTNEATSFYLDAMELAKHYEGVEYVK